MKVAVVHDYLTQRGGAERVACLISDAFPGAPVLTSLYEADHTYPEFTGKDVRTSPLQRLAFLRRHFRVALPLFPWAFDHLAVPADADVVVVSTTGFAHGIHTSARKVVYCHSPARFLYLSDEYLGGPWWSKPAGWPLMVLRPALRAWDQRAARSADVYLANSTVVQARIREVYGIEAQVLHPPVGIDPEGVRSVIREAADWPDHHLIVSRLLPYKNVDKAIDAFRTMPDERLLIVGHGPEKDRLMADLPGNVRIVSGLDDAQLRTAYAQARALIAPSHEDFGLTPIEGFSFGVPALTLRAGGYLDTVIDGEVGYFFDTPTPSDIVEAVQRLVERPLDRSAIRRRATDFSVASFSDRLRRIVEEVAR